MLVTPDEQRILTLLAAAQLSDRALLDAHLLWLAACDHRPAFRRLTLAWAQLLAAHGHRISIALELPVMAYIPIAAVEPRPREALKL